MKHPFSVRVEKNGTVQSVFFQDYNLTSIISGDMQSPQEQDIFLSDC